MTILSINHKNHANWIPLITSTLDFRREALNTWKRKLGSNATYSKLIEVFERAGYKNYADSVVRIMSESLGEIEMSIGKFDSLQFNSDGPDIYII